MSSENRIGIIEARKLVRDLQGDYNKRNKRIHEEAMEIASQQMRVLSGDVCASCQHLLSTKKFIDGRLRVRLECAVGRDPVEMYRSVERGHQSEVCCDEWTSF